MFDYVMLGNVR